MLHTDRLLELAAISVRPCISIYSQTGAAGADSAGDPIRLKHAIQQAEARLGELGFESRETERLLAPATDFLANLSPTSYADGTLAVLLGGDTVEILHSPLRVETQVFVSDRLHLKPLLPVLTENARFYVLAVSEKQVRLYECTRFSQRELPLADTAAPTSLEDAQHAPVQPPEGTPARTVVVGARGGNRGAAIYYGGGDENSVRYHELFHFLREVSTGIAPLLDGRSPLIFAGVDELFAIFRHANTCDHLADTALSGNPDHVRPEELRARGWEIVAAAMEQRIAEAHEAFGVLGARGRATDDVKAAALAARDGLAGTIIGATDTVIWGRVSDSGDDVEYRPQPEPWDYDLIDYAAMQAMEHSGTALMVPAPRVPGNGRGLAALLRY
ncbi:MAG: hypothetical protein AB7Y46_19210 [Armatimonadota bacterium]